jgi:hypothetical protein
MDKINRAGGTFRRPFLMESARAEVHADARGDFPFAEGDRRIAHRRWPDDHCPSCAGHSHAPPCAE